VNKINRCQKLGRIELMYIVIHTQAYKSAFTSSI